jgi:hypothetical protein
MENVRARFREIVARATERAAREWAEHLVSLRPVRRHGRTRRRQIHDDITAQTLRGRRKAR